MQTLAGESGIGLEEERHTQVTTMMTYSLNNKHFQMKRTKVPKQEQRETGGHSRLGFGQTSPTPLFIRKTN